jgi:hypothetical protein
MISSGEPRASRGAPLSHGLQPTIQLRENGTRIEVREGSVVFIPEDHSFPSLRLRSSVPVEVINGDVFADFRLERGECASFVLEEVEAGEESPSSAPDYIASSFKETLNFWQDWIGRSHYKVRWREMVNRSAVVSRTPRVVEGVP